MRIQFPHRLHTQKLFCRRCGQVSAHGLFAKEPYSTYGGIEPHIPLLCVCDHCETTFVMFSNEFTIGRKENAGDYTKVYGYNRIIPGNWVYFKGTVKPGLVKSFFQSADKEVVLVRYDGGVEKKIEGPKVVVQNEVAPEGYRLLPAQTAQILVGDHVYHSIRDKFGVSVGFVNDGEQDKLAVQLDDGALLFITLPQIAQNVPNVKLREIAQTKLQQLFPEDYRRVAITVGQGIVYLNGIVRNLSVKRAICACINAIPRVRGCVDFTKVQVDSYTTDSQIERSILMMLETPGLRIFDYEVSVNKGVVKLKYSCYEEYFPKEVENRIAEIPGVQDLSISVSSMPVSQAENDVSCKEMEYELAVNSLLSGSVIRVSYVRNKYLLEGRVCSLLQKQMAYICAAKKAKNPLIDNRLRIA